MAHGGRARGEMGGGTREQCGSNKACTVTTGLIWLVTRVGGWGEAWGGGPWRAGKGGDGGGHQRAVWEQQERALVSPFWAPLKTYNWSDLASDEGGGMGGGVGRWPMEGGARGEMGGGTREQCVGATKRALVPPFGLP